MNEEELMVLGEILAEDEGLDPEAFKAFLKELGIGSAMSYADAESKIRYALDRFRGGAPGAETPAETPVSPTGELAPRIGTEPGQPAAPSPLEPPRPIDKASLQSYARQRATAKGVRPEVVDRMLMVESGYNPNSRGEAGEIGIAQIIPKWHPNANPTDPYASIDYMVDFLAKRLADTGGDYYKAVGSWNGGSGTLDAGRETPGTKGYIRSVLGYLPGGLGVSDRPEFGGDRISAALQRAPIEGESPIRPIRDIRPGEFTPPEGGYYFQTNELGRPTGTAVQAALELAGYPNEKANPFTELLSRVTPQIFQGERLRRVLGKGDVEEWMANPALLGETVAAYLKSGATSAIEDPKGALRQLRDLSKLYDTNPALVYDPYQNDLIGRLREDPEEAIRAIGTIQGTALAPGMGNALTGGLRRMAERYGMDAPALGMPSLMEYLLRGMVQ